MWNTCHILAAISPPKHNIDIEIHYCLSYASQAFSRLRQRALENHDLQLRTKVLMHVIHTKLMVTFLV